MTIHDRARQMAAQSRTPMTQAQALSILGKRGARRRAARKPKSSQQPQTYAWQDRADLQ
jgi:hypothetical protein